MPHTNKTHESALFLNHRGFTLIELMIVVLIIALLTTTAGLLFSTMRQKACITIARYDLKKFFEAEHQYYSDNSMYCGKTGDILSNAPMVKSTFSLDNYSPSKGTYITIIKDDPFTAQAMQLGIDLVFECDILTGIIKERHDP